MLVVGGGAAGVELALALHARWSKHFPSLQVQQQDSLESRTAAAAAAAHGIA